jgi:hypothetical protein
MVATDNTIVCSSESVLLQTFQKLVLLFKLYATCIFFFLSIVECLLKGLQLSHLVQLNLAPNGTFSVPRP